MLCDSVPDPIRCVHAFSRWLSIEALSPDQRRSFDRLCPCTICRNTDAHDLFRFAVEAVERTPGNSPLRALNLKTHLSGETHRPSLGCNRLEPIALRSEYTG